MINTCHRFIGGNRYHIHAVNVTELFFLGEGGTGHAGFLLKFIKEVLEGNGGQSLALTFHLYMLFRLDCLMQTVGITASRHDTSGKFIDNQYFPVFYHIILVTEHEVVGTESQNDIVLDLQVFRIRIVFDVEEFLYLGDTFLGQIDDLVLLIDDEIAGLLTLHSHDGIHLGQFFHILTTFHLTGQNIACLVKTGGFAAHTGNDQRRTGFIDQDGVHLIDDGVV